MLDLVRLAKIDADEHSSVKETYEVRGFPTIIYFSNSQQIKYNGQRTKEFMVNWLNKKTKPAVTELEVSQLGELSTNGKVNIVFHGDVASHEHGNLFKELAIADDYNSIFAFIKLTTASKELNRLLEQFKYSDLSGSQLAP